MAAGAVVTGAVVTGGVVTGAVVTAAVVGGAVVTGAVVVGAMGAVVAGGDSVDGDAGDEPVEPRAVPLGFGSSLVAAGKPLGSPDGAGEDSSTRTEFAAVATAGVYEEAADDSWGPADLVPGCTCTELAGSRIAYTVRPPSPKPITTDSITSRVQLTGNAR